MNIDSPPYLIQSPDVTISQDSFRSQSFDQKDYNVKKRETSNVFDSGLTTFLEHNSINRERISVVVVFADNTDKIDRVDALDSILDDMVIIGNYDIVPAVALECNPVELLSKSHLFDDNVIIKSVYKSRTFTQPYLDDLKPKTSALNLYNYSNWWLSAIGGNNLEYNGSGVRVGVIDSGVYDHPDLNYDPSNDAMNFVPNEGTGVYNPSEFEDKNGHGTHCAGIIASTGGASRGEYRGVAPGATIVNARAGSIFGGLNETHILNAIDWCVNPTQGNADIISMSFGGGHPVAEDAITRAINYATSQGVICVASAGNSGPEFFTGGTPGTATSVITVGASNSDNELASFSSRGPTFSHLSYPDVVAPGVHIISTMAPDTVIAREYQYTGDVFNFIGDADYIPLSGTSMSCPMVAGSIAILKEAYPSLNPETARIALLEGANPLADEADARILNSGAGLINITASLEYLNFINSTFGDVNKAIKVFPYDLPVQPFDLLNFPGDRQEFNLTIISGVNDTFIIEIPSSTNDGVIFSIDKSTVYFEQRGVNFTSLSIFIEDDAIPGPRSYVINVTNGNGLYTTVNISFTVSLPEHRILMESYHGLNDMYFIKTPNNMANSTNLFYQMGFYEAMSDITARNISIDYMAEFWTPNYDKISNSFLTSEKMAQYDLIVLQNPILPFNPLEMEAIDGYYRNGGNILFLGTYHEKLCVDSVNSLFLLLDSGIQIIKENLVNLTYAGIFSDLNEYEISNISASHPIVQDVSKVYWEGSATLNVSGPNAEVLARHGDRDLIAACDGSSGTGKIVAFADSNWMHYDYTQQGYDKNHTRMLNNLMNYFFPEEDISLNLRIDTERTSVDQFGLTLYAKNQSSELPISGSDYDSMLVTIENGPYSDTIQLNGSMHLNGIYFNNTVRIPSPNALAYNITVIVDINGKIYNTSSKILYYNDTMLPVITSLNTSSDISNRGLSVEINASLSVSSNVSGHTSIFSGNLLSVRPLVNRSYDLIDEGGGTYGHDFSVLSSDPSGFAITYICAQSLDNFTNPFSPRVVFYIDNEAPEIDALNSEIDGLVIDDLFEGDSVSVISVTQNDRVFFEIQADDTEDNSEDLKVALTLFICSIHAISSEGGSAIPIFPAVLENEQLGYNSLTGKHEISYTIPSRMIYSTITGTKSISTKTNLRSGGDKVAILFITVIDSDGAFNNYDDAENYLTVFFDINPLEDSIDPILILVIVLLIIGGIGLATVIVVNRRRPENRKGIQPYPEYYRPSPGEGDLQDGEYYSEKIPVDTAKLNSMATGRLCTHCGKKIDGSVKFCTHCGNPSPIG